MSTMSCLRRKMPSYWDVKHRRILHGRKRKQEKLLSLGERISESQKQTLKRLQGFFGHFLRQRRQGAR